MRVEFGHFTFDSDAREIRGSTGHAVHLTPKAFDLLHALIAERPRAMTSAELRERLWPDVVVADANLKNLVREVRAALGAETIRTVQRHGYAFAAQESAVVKAYLVGHTTSHHLKRGRNVIGRGPVCDVVLNFTGVSREHAAIHAAAGEYTIEDLDSKNGTWVNDRQVASTTTTLRDGDRVRFGALLLTFRASADVASTTTIGEGGA